MAFEEPDPTWRPEPTKGGGQGIIGLLLFVLIGVLVVAGGGLYVELRSTYSSIVQVRQKVESYDERIAKLEGAVARTQKQAEANIATLRGEVTSTRSQLSQANQSTPSTLLKDVLSKTRQMTEQMHAEQKAELAKIGSEVEQLKSTTGTTDSKLGSLSGEVGAVKSEVSSTKSELQKTIAELKSVRGDLGVQSGLIATNATELSALKRVGERNYYEFKLTKTKQPQRVGRVTLTLKRTDFKRNRYSLDILADDKLAEKKDRAVNEPVQFYAGRSKMPSEIVVNEIGKDRIVGYLSTPKDQ